MKAREILAQIPWDLVQRAGAAGIGLLRRARSLRHAEDLVAWLEQLGVVPEVELDRIVERVNRIGVQVPGAGPLDAGD